MWAAYADAATKVGSTNADGASSARPCWGPPQRGRHPQRGVEHRRPAVVDHPTQVGADVDEVNSMASSVAVLNEQIQKATTTGGAPTS